MGNNTQDIQILDGLAVFYALQKLAQETGYYGCTSVEYLDDDNPRIEFNVKRVAYDGNGSHVGTEVFTGVLPLISYRLIGAHGITPQSEYWTTLGSLGVDHIEPAQSEIEYNEAWAICMLNVNGIKWSNAYALGEIDDLVQYAHDQGLSDGDYCSPPEDFAYTELEYFLKMALDNLPRGFFMFSDVFKHRQWHIAFEDGSEIVSSYCLDCEGDCNV